MILLQDIVKHGEKRETQKRKSEEKEEKTKKRMSDKDMILV